MDGQHTYSKSTAIFVTATLLKICNYRSFNFQQRQVYPSLRGGLATFLMLLPVLSCVAFIQFPILRKSQTVFLEIIYTKYAIRPLAVPAPHTFLSSLGGTS